MKYTLTFSEQVHGQLAAHLFDGQMIERAGYLLCGVSRTQDEVRLLTRRFLPVEDEHIRVATAEGMSIESASYAAALGNASRDDSAFVFVHSHPTGPPQHSPKDDREIPALMLAAHIRIPGPKVHGSLVFFNEETIDGRVYDDRGTATQISMIRIIGSRYRFLFSDATKMDVPEHFDRQVKAFGREAQALLGHLHVGVVGFGGTGSPTTEQLIRLGIGRITVFDGDTFGASNVSRVYGSGVADEGRSKVTIAEDLAHRIGLGTTFTPMNRPITQEAVCKELRACDIIFGCTDDEWGRSLLTRFPAAYLIPVIDLGVKIHSEDGLISRVTGRVTVLTQGRACLFCRRRISPARIASEAEHELNPSLAKQRRRERYLPELGHVEPSVVFLTTAVAASAVREFVDRILSFGDTEARGDDEILHRFERGDMRRSISVGLDDCFCGDARAWGRGDTTPFLEVSWPR